MAVSEELIFRLQLHPLPQYKLAMLIGLHYTTLSQFVNGIERVRSGDEQVLAIGRVLGLNTITEHAKVLMNNSLLVPSAGF